MRVRGIGKATALRLAGMGGRVVMVCRDRERGEAVIGEAKLRTGVNSTELMLADMSSLQSVRSLAKDFVDAHKRLDVLINNAGVFKNRHVLTADGFETMFATNHLGPFLLTTLLLEVLKRSAPSRILNISAPSTVPPNFEDLQGERKFSALNAFGASKACNLLFTYELARRLEGTGVTVNAIHPGLARSKLMKEASVLIRLFARLISRSPERAAKIVSYYASSSEIENVNGKFFKGMRTMESAPFMDNRDAQRRLWDVSSMLAGVY